MRRFKCSALGLSILLANLGCATYLHAEESSSSNAELKKQLDDYKAKLEKLTTQVKRDEDAATTEKNKNQELASRIKINGFMTAALARNDGKKATLLGGLGNYSDPNTDSKLGLQFDFKLNPEDHVVVQFLSKGSAYHAVNSEWLYLSKAITPSTRLIAGRFAPPFYFLSDVQNVGFSYPWVRPPVELYNLPVDGTEGFQLQNRFTLGKWEALGTATYGRIRSQEHEFSGATFSSDHEFGATLEFSNDPWTVRFSYTNSEVVIHTLDAGGQLDTLKSQFEQLVTQTEQINEALHTSLPTNNYHLTLAVPQSEYYNAALQFDNGKWLAISELGRLRDPLLGFPSGVGGYVLVGDRIGKWMPFVSVAKFYTDKASDRAQDRVINDMTAFKQAVEPLLPLLPAAMTAQYNQLVDGINALNRTKQQQISGTIGVNYSVLPQVKLKLEASQFGDFGTSTGRFVGDPGRQVRLYSLALDTVF